MKTIALALALLGLLAPLLCAQAQAVIKEATGKVELLSAPQAWVPAKAGMKVTPGTTISTGFNSTAVLDLGGSILSVRPLTRMRLEELVQKQGTVQTGLFLQLGKVKAEVKTAAGLTQDLKVRSPVSTAAVRGTGFEYDGYELYVYEGVVTYSNLLGQERTYGAGEEGSTNGSDTPTEGQAGKEGASGVNPFAPGLGGASGSGLATAAVSTGGLIIVIPYMY